MKTYYKFIKNLENDNCHFLLQKCSKKLKILSNSSNRSNDILKIIKYDMLLQLHHIFGELNDITILELSVKYNKFKLFMLLQHVRGTFGIYIWLSTILYSTLKFNNYKIFKYLVINIWRRDNYELSEYLIVGSKYGCTRIVEWLFTTYYTSFDYFEIINAINTAKKYNHTDIYNFLISNTDFDINCYSL